MARARRRLVRGALAAAVAVAAMTPTVAPADIQEQRARLPPPAHCGDPVVGLWRSHKYNPNYADWTVFTIEVRRLQGDPSRLEGRIVNESWSGGPNDPNAPTTCGPGFKHWRVGMPMQGTITEGRIDVWGTSWTIEQQWCERWTGYNLDHFTGQIDPDLEEFQTVNNDGGRAIDDPTLFRRVQCYDGTPLPAPHVTVTPPPFYPRLRTPGCSHD